MSSLLAMPMKMIQMLPLMHLKLLKTWMILRVLKEMKVTRKLNISPSKILIWKKNIPLLPVSFEWHKRFLNILLLKGTTNSSYYHQGSTDRQQLDHGSTHFFSEAMYKECLALCDFVNEEIRKFSCSALMHLALGMFKISNNDAGLKEAVKKALEMIQQDTDNGVALLLMAELSDVIDKYGKPLFTREVMECVINALKGELICMMGKFHNSFLLCNS